MIDFVFIGATAYDLIARVDRNIKAAGHYRFTEWSLSFGGKAANAAAYFARSGGSAAFIGVVGRDFESLGYKKYLERLGVDVQDVIIAASRTPLFVSMRSGASEYAFCGHAEKLPLKPGTLETHFKKQLVRKAPRGVYCTLSEPGLTLEIMKTAAAAGIRTAWNPIFYTESVPEFEHILPYIDSLFLNRAEADRLVDILDLRLEEIVSKCDIACISVTQGAGGVDIITKAGIQRIQAADIPDPVDATGAGDAYAGTFLACYDKLGANEIARCAEEANRVAAETTLRLGAQIPL